VLMLGLVSSFLWILPALSLGDPAFVRLPATQFLLLVGAAIVIMIERQVESRAALSVTEVPMRVVPTPEAGMPSALDAGLMPRW